jgi:hypothetical protein
MDDWRGYTSKYRATTTIRHELPYLKWALYASGICLLLFIVLMTIHFTIRPIFSFLPGDGGTISMPTATTEQLAFSKGPASVDVSCNIINIVSKNYTLSLDVFLSSGFYTTSVPRVLLYLSDKQITMAGTDTTDSLLSRFPSTNVFIWVDSMKNDLYVTAVGVDPKGTSHLLNSKPIENVPLRDPFRITIVVATGFIEIYMNGELVQTMNLGYPLKNIDGTAPTYYFATPMPVFNSVQIANISYWNNILPSKSIRAQHQLRTLDKTLFIK